jgi:hypothetical protein
MDAPKRAYSSFAIFTKATPSVSLVAVLIGIWISLSSTLRLFWFSVLRMSAISLGTLS